MKVTADKSKLVGEPAEARIRWGVLYRTERAGIESGRTFGGIRAQDKTCGTKSRETYRVLYLDPRHPTRLPKERGRLTSL